MTGPEHVQEALRLADLAEQEYWDSPTGAPVVGGGAHKPSDDERQRMLLRAHLHASLARTAEHIDDTKEQPTPDAEIVDPYVYFVSVAHAGGFGFRVVGMQCLVDSPDKVLSLDDAIKSTYPHGQATVMSFQLLSGPEQR